MYKLYLSNTDRFEGRGSPSEQAILQGYGLRSTVQKGRRTRKLLLERGVTCLGGVTQLHCGESLGQRASKGSCVLFCCFVCSGFVFLVDPWFLSVAISY